MKRPVKIALPVSSCPFAGIGLAEIMVVVLIAAVALVPVFGLLSSNARHVSFNQDRAVARILATQVIERYRLETFGFLRRNFSSFQQGADTIESDDVLVQLFFDLPEKTEGLYRKFTREAQFTETIPGLLGEFTCRVSWTNNQGKRREQVSTVLLKSPDFHYGKP